MYYAEKSLKTWIKANPGHPLTPDIRTAIATLEDYRSIIGRAKSILDIAPIPPAGHTTLPPCPPTEPKEPTRRQINGMILILNAAIWDLCLKFGVRPEQAIGLGVERLKDMPPAEIRQMLDKIGGCIDQIPDEPPA